MGIGDIFSFVFDPIGAIMGNENQRKNRRAQEDFAKKGIRWRVADAEAAGLHPLAALGAQPAAAQPVPSAPSPAKMHIKMANAQLDKLKAETDKTKAETRKMQITQQPLPMQNMQTMMMQPGIATRPGFGKPKPSYIHTPGPDRMTAQVIVNPDISDTYESSQLDAALGAVRRIWDADRNQYRKMFEPPKSWLKPGMKWRSSTPYLWEQVPINPRGKRNKMMLPARRLKSMKRHPPRNVQRYENMRRY